MSEVQGSSRHLIKSFEAQELKKRPFVIQLADYLTSFFGGIPFLSFNLVLFTFWIIVNIGDVPGIPAFDPFPFTLLTMVVSLEAIFLAIIVLMSQNRQNYVSTLRQELDMQVNLIAEREITKILKFLKASLAKQDVKVDDPELAEMLKETDISYIERQIVKQLEPANTGAKELVKEVEKAILQKK